MPEPRRSTIGLQTAHIRLGGMILLLLHAPGLAAHRPLWAAVFAVSLWGNGDHGERGGIGLKISPRGTHRYTA